MICIIITQTAMPALLGLFTPPFASICMKNTLSLPFISASNEPGKYAWHRPKRSVKLPRGSNIPLPAKGYLIQLISFPFLFFIISNRGRIINQNKLIEQGTGIRYKRISVHILCCSPDLAAPFSEVLPRIRFRYLFRLALSHLCPCQSTSVYKTPVSSYISFQGNIKQKYSLTWKYFQCEGMMLRFILYLF